MKNKRKPNTLIIRLGAMVIILIAIYFAVILLMDRTEPPTHTQEAPAPDTFVHDGEPLIETVIRWHQEEDLDRNAINTQLPEPFELLVLDEDINANGAPNYLMISKRTGEMPEMSSMLTDVGFTHIFRDLVVYESRERELFPILAIDEASITDEQGNRMIDQVPAEYGYALILEPYENDALYDDTVTLIEIVMLDSDGRDASDDIVIYWDTSESLFKATNTFGAP